MTEITEATIKKFLEENKLEYLPTHDKLSLPIINRIYKKMLYDIKFEIVKVNENIIVD
jgi:hypothetical protein